MHQQRVQNLRPPEVRLSVPGSLCVTVCRWCTSTWEDGGTESREYLCCVAVNRNGAAAGARQVGCRGGLYFL